MKFDYGYDSYRGRSGFRTFLTVVISVLLVALAASIAAFIFLQDYLVYGDDGQVRIELPGQLVGGTKASEPPEELIIVTAAPEESVSPEGGAEGQPAASDNTAAGQLGISEGVAAGEPVGPEEPTNVSPVPNPEVGNTFQAIMLSEDELTGSPPSAERLGSASAVVLDMKGDDGQLRYVSQSGRAKGLNTSSAASGRNAAIEAVTGAEGYTIARISCFRDYRAPRQNNNLALRTSQGNWIDPGQMRWLNPAVGDARSYVVEVCAELAGMGFDELLLDNAFYPFEGKIQQILRNKNYDPANLNVPIEAFYQEVKAACPDVKLSIVAAPEGLVAESNVTGQSAELLAQYADRVYVRTENLEALQAAEAVLTAAGLAPEQIVCWHEAGENVLAAAGGEATWLP